MEGTNQSFVKKRNQQTIIQYILSYGSISRAELASKLKMSKPAVSSNVKELMEQGIIVEIGIHDTSVGKKGTLIDLNIDYRYLLILDLSEKTIKVAVGNLKGNIIFKEEIPIPIEPNIEIMQQHIEMYLYGCFAKHKICSEQIGRVIVGVPGIIDDVKEKRAIEEYIVEFKNISVRKLCESIFSVPVKVMNDINLAAIGERHFGGHNQPNNMMYVWLLQGIGAGIILDGELYQGPRAAAGEIGFIKVHGEDGKMITLFDAVGMQAIEGHLKTHIGEISFEIFIKRVHEGDDECCQFAKKLGSIIGPILGNIALFLDLELIVLGGILIQIGEVFINEVRTQIERCMINPIEVKVSQINNPVIYGGLKIGLDEMIKNLV